MSCKCDDFGAMEEQCPQVQWRTETGYMPLKVRPARTCHSAKNMLSGGPISINVTTKALSEPLFCCVAMGDLALGGFNISCSPTRKVSALLKTNKLNR